MASTTAPAPVGEISVLYNQLQQSIAILRGKIQAIDERMAPVLRSQGPAPAPAPVSVAQQNQPHTDHGMRLNELLTTTDGMCNHAQNILDRLEL